MGAEGDRMTYTLVTECEMDAWTDETFLLHEQTTPAAELHTHLPSTLRMSLHFLTQSQEMYLRASHELADGLGMVMLLDALCHDMMYPHKPPYGPHTANL